MQSAIRSVAGGFFLLVAAASSIGLFIWRPQNPSGFAVLALALFVGSVGFGLAFWPEHRWRVFGSAVSVSALAAGWLAVLPRPSETQLPPATSAASNEPSVATKSSPPNASPSPVGSATPAPEPLSDGDIVSLSCSTETRRATRGVPFQVTYKVTTRRNGTVGLGAGAYSEMGEDFARGDGDVSEYVLAAGDATITRHLSLADTAPTGQYEIVAELWPTNKIGLEGVEVLLKGEATCGIATLE